VNYKIFFHFAPYLSEVLKNAKITRESNKVKTAIQEFLYRFVDGSFVTLYDMLSVY
jgi:hypothetical protein